MTKRADRIGTPALYEFSTGSANWDFVTPAASQGAYDQGPVPLNIVNAVPGQDYQVVAVDTQTAGAGFARGNKYGLGQQFTVPKPKEGNCTLVEVYGSVAMDCMAVASITPIFTRINAAVATAFGAATITGIGLGIGTPLDPMVTGLASTDVVRRRITWKERVLIYENPMESRVFAHGFSVSDPGAGGTATWQKFNGYFGIRTLWAPETILRFADPFN